MSALLVSWVLTALGVFVSVAWFTLVERKWLSAPQTRLGPMFCGPLGVLQPFSDAIKLIAKQCFYLKSGSQVLHVLAPCVMLGMVLVAVVMMPFTSSLIQYLFMLLFYILLASIVSMCVLISGWASTSVYATLGALRSVAQTISYEVGLAFVFLSVMICSGQLALFQLSESQIMGPFMLLIPHLALILRKGSQS